MKSTLVFIGLVLCLLTPFAGCADKDMPLSEGNKAGLTNAIFQLNIALDGEGGMSRSGKAHPNGSTPGHSIETAIHTVHLFVVPVTSVSGGEEAEQWDQMKYGVTSISSGTFTNPIQVPVEEIPSTKMHVYVGANLSQAQVNAFKEPYDTPATEREYTTEESYYKDAINEFAPFHIDERGGVEAKSRNPENIAMFARDMLTVDVNTDNDTSGDDTAEEKKSIDIGTVYLKRMVAKVLVTCATQEGSSNGDEKNGFAPGGLSDVYYVKLTGEFTTNENAKPKGWIRQSDVYYFINNMPRRTRFLQTYTDTDNDGRKETLKPNYNLKEAMTDLDTQFSPLDFNKQKVNDIFIHYDQLELYNHNSSFKESSVWNEDTYKDLVKNGGPSANNAYNKNGIGMYTLENVFDTDGITENEMSQLMEYAAVPVVTQVSIAACFTPRFIYVTKEEWEDGMNKEEPNPIKAMKLPEHEETLEELLKDKVHEVVPANDDYRLLECPNEEVAQFILTASLRIHGRLTGNDGKDEYVPGTHGDDARYPINTYFVYSGANEAAFNTYGTASKGNKNGGDTDYAAIWPEMVPFTRGWGYYYTYINNVADGPIDDLSQSCIERNCYYILTVNSIGHMGASVTDPKYIKVYTRKAVWQDGGSGEITLH